MIWTLVAAAFPAYANKKVALVIGNASYQHTAALANPLNDAADITSALRKLEFQVIEGRDLDKLGMDKTIRQFARELVGADLGVFFYAGHGLQVDGQNFLVPVDAKLEDATGLEFEAVRLDTIHRTMERATRTNLVFLDACRDNPLARNLARSLGTRSSTVGRGLAVVESGEGTMISFSTQPGNVAQDGSGRNSPYAGALAKQLQAAKDDVSSMLINVRNDVMAETKRRQVPWEHTALTAKVYFAPIEQLKPAPATGASTLPPAPSYAQQAELAFWATIKDSRDPSVLQTYLDAYPQGSFAVLARVLIDKAKTETAREQDLRMAEAAKREAEGRKKADEVKRLQEEAKTAHAALAAAEKERQDALAAAEAMRKQDEQKSSQVAALVPAAPATVPVLTRDTEDLARDIQRELKRVGCDPGAVDGKWGAKARAALGDFSQRVKVAMTTDEPTSSALDLLKERKGRICPLECDDGEVERGGQCVTIPKRAPPVAKEATTARPAKSESGGNCRIETVDECTSRVGKRTAGTTSLNVSNPCVFESSRIKVCK